MKIVFFASPIGMIFSEKAAEAVAGNPTATVTQSPNKQDRMSKTHGETNGKKKGKQIKQGNGKFKGNSLKNPYGTNDGEVENWEIAMDTEKPTDN